MRLGRLSPELPFAASVRSVLAVRPFVFRGVGAGWALGRLENRSCFLDRFFILLRESTGREPMESLCYSLSEGFGSGTGKLGIVLGHQRSRMTDDSGDVIIRKCERRGPGIFWASPPF